MDPFVRQTFKATAAGSITAIEFLIKNSPDSGSSDFDMSISGTRIILPFKHSSWTWYTIILDNQIRLMRIHPILWIFTDQAL